MGGQFSVQGRVQSFIYAFRGLGFMLKSQHNAWIHAAATVLVVGAGVWLRIDGRDWALLIIAMVSVWVAEALNTALELIADAVSPEHHPLIGVAKDVAAAAVLLAATGAAVIGFIVFVPQLAGP